MKWDLTSNQIARTIQKDYKNKKIIWEINTKDYQDNFKKVLKVIEILKNQVEIQVTDSVNENSILFKERRD